MDIRKDIHLSSGYMLNFFWDNPLLPYADMRSNWKTLTKWIQYNLLFGTDLLQRGHKSQSLIEQTEVICQYLKGDNILNINRTTPHNDKI
ncbi:hypothetical protein GcC1_174017 [Golovinomyces cichoracearum]|uniref:Uncharacterized protein n=1 Tax=Golovinomyces cichoracearum TaxID=62708 RepID=A0A420HQ52_9PEZI|nr:hypothetical protein GcC1_174017 [Golovinomyces cichoracearum]